MKRHSITIKDIAKELNISVPTVSRALRNTHDVNEQTRQSVLAKAAELNYKPNFNAIGLVKNSSNNIGIILPVITNYYFSTVITGIQEIAFTNGFNMVLFLTDDSAEREKAILDELSFSNIDGLLICISSMPDQSDRFQQVIDNGIPIVFFDRVPSGIKTSKIMQDDFNGAFKAVEHLIQCGYKKIAHISGPEGLLITEKRQEGYLAALKKYKLPAGKKWIIHSGFSQKCGEEDMLRLLLCKERPDAVFAVNDRKAVGAMLTLKKKNIVIGKDIGIIGFTNDPISEIVHPSLTTMEEPALEIGRKSCELLIKHLRKKKFIPEEIILPTKLIIRDSTKRK
ncbi:LacI family DNA-binding transcriptional regulator [Flavitalea flava]